MNETKWMSRFGIAVKSPLNHVFTCALLGSGVEILLIFLRVIDRVTRSLPLVSNTLNTSTMLT